MHFLVPAITLLAFVPVSTVAHEFWIEPLDHTVSVGDSVEANLKVGQNYSGSDFPLFPSRLVQLFVTGPLGTSNISGTIGDIPAIRLPDLPQGLHILAYESTTDRLDFEDWDLFTSYVAYEGNDWAVASHLGAGLPKTGFSEGYRRYAKSLVQIGAATDVDTDREVGFEIELIAMKSPYALPPGETELPVKLLWRGAPLAGQQINIFHRADAATLSAVTTDQNGRVMVPVSAQGRYLLNAVHMELNTTDEELAWDSHWGSLTFEIAPRQEQ